MRSKLLLGSISVLLPVVMLSPPATAASAPADRVRQERIDDVQARITAKVDRMTRAEVLMVRPDLMPASGQPKRSGANLSMQEDLPDSATASGAAVSSESRTAPSQAPCSQVKTISVNCNRGQSLSEAIARTDSPRLVVKVSGTCRETVVVGKPGVTITGPESHPAIIDPPDDPAGVPTGPAIRALGAHDLTLENLVLTGGLDGLEARASMDMSLKHVQAVRNRGPAPYEHGFGIYLRASSAMIESSNLSENGIPLGVASHSTAWVQDSSITANSEDGPNTWDHSRLDLVRCNVANNPWGPQAYYGSETVVSASTVQDSGESAAAWMSELRYQDSSLTGMIGVGAWFGSQLWFSETTAIGGYLRAVGDSAATFVGSTFESNGPGSYMVANVGSYLYVDADYLSDGTIVPSTVHSDVRIANFSEASLWTSEPIVGAINCWGRSRVECSADPTGGMNGCE